MKGEESLRGSQNCLETLWGGHWAQCLSSHSGLLQPMSESLHLISAPAHLIQLPAEGQAEAAGHGSTAWVLVGSLGDPGRCRHLRSEPGRKLSFSLFAPFLNKMKITPLQKYNSFHSLALRINGKKCQRECRNLGKHCR